MNFLNEIPTNKCLILFDGVCNYCNKMVNFAIKHDKNDQLRFASLQSNLGIALKSKYKIDNKVDSLVVIDNNQVFIYAEAAIHICQYFKNPYKKLFILRYFPTALSNFFYKIIASNRYKLFGKSLVCRIPSKDEKGKFIDG
jgi:predicted DCC family thiol-disulfide oxidoreductase YuxK